MKKYFFSRTVSVVTFLLIATGCHLHSTSLHAATKNPAYEKSIEAGVTFLKGEIHKSTQGYKVFAAYALLKAGEPANGKHIQDVIKQILSKIQEGKYQSNGALKRHYEAGVSLMLLVDGTGKKHMPAIQAITQYLIDEQFENGSWGYFGPNEGDTSVVQYAILGLWAAQRVGVKIPPKVWDKAAEWHISKQSNKGGFAYIPGHSKGDGRGSPTRNMTSAASGSMLIIRSIQFPAEPEWAENKGKANGNKKKGPLDKLEKIDTTKVMTRMTSKKKDDKKVVDMGDYEPVVKVSSLNDSIKSGLSWSRIQFRPRISSQFHMYYYYTMERMTALAGIDNIKDKDWFDSCADEVLKMQKKDGGWDSHLGRISATSFALLFLTRSTAKLIGRLPKDNPIGTGLLAAGRGLPDDLSKVRESGGKVQEKKSNDPLAKQLSELEKIDASKIDSLTTEVVEKIQIGDPEELVGQRKMLLKLVNNKRPDVRKIALWALGRSGNLSDARLMIDALNAEDNVDVLIEARNALCFLSHKANGFGFPSSPFSDLAENASQEQKDEAMAKWKKSVYKKWVAWYLEIRPYNEKNDLLELSIQR